MPRFLEFFAVGARQRAGVVLLSAILTAVLLLRYLQKPPPQAVKLDRAAMESIQSKVDSIRAARSNKKQKIYPFNPNFLTDYRAYMLGIPIEALDRLRAFRQGGKWINSAADFGRVTGIEDSLLEAIAPYFKFPAWLDDRKKQGKPVTRKPVDPGGRMDLNKAGAADLQQVNGIGKVLSRRIIEQRTRLGGFASTDQLYGVYGLSDSVVSRAKKHFVIREPAALERLNINTASASDLSTIPGISFELGREIWEFVRLREGVSSLSELEKVDGLSPRLLRLIAVYLYVK